MTTNKRKREPEEEAGSAEPQGTVKKVQKEPPSLVLTALEKLTDLQRLLADEPVSDLDTDDDSDFSDSESGIEESENVPKFSPEIIGFAVCAQETLNFLRSEGFCEEDALVKNMQSRLLDQLSDYQSSLKDTCRAKSV